MRSPRLLMLPSLSLPPLEFCFGTSPIQAEKSLPDRNAFGSAMLATRAVANAGPTPGMSSSRRLASLDRCQALIIQSNSRICAFSVCSWAPRAATQSRATSGNRKSKGSGHRLSLQTFLSETDAFVMRRPESTTALFGNCGVLLVQHVKCNLHRGGAALGVGSTARAAHMGVGGGGVDLRTAVVLEARVLRLWWQRYGRLL
jgi:hypothetical protein